MNIIIYRIVGFKRDRVVSVKRAINLHEEQRDGTNQINNVNKLRTECLLEKNPNKFDFYSKSYEI